MRTTVLRAAAAAEPGRIVISVLLARRSRTPLLLSVPGGKAWRPLQVLGEPRMGGREGGVNRPEEREWRRGEDRGETLQGCW